MAALPLMLIIGAAILAQATAFFLIFWLVRSRSRRKMTATENE